MKSAMTKARAPRITPAMRKVVELLATGKVSQQVDAAAKAGLSSEHVCRMLRRPEVKALLERRAHEILSQGKIRAAHKVMELVDADSEHVALDAAKHVLGIGGIKPAETPAALVQVNVAPGYVIERYREAGAPVTIEHEPVVAVEE